MKKKLYTILTLTLMTSMLMFGCGQEADDDDDDDRRPAKKTESSVEESDEEKESSVADVVSSKEDEVAPASSEEVVVNDDIANSPGAQYAAGVYTTIEEYFNDSAIAEIYEGIVDDTIASGGGVFTNVSFGADVNDVVINYYIASEYAETVKTNMSATDIDDLADQSIDQIKSECGIQPSSLTFAYYSEDGELLGKGIATR